MEKQIKIIRSPFNSNVEAVGNIIISIHVPYSENDVNIKINPNIQEYKENNNQPGVQVKQVMITTQTDETKILHFDFKDDNIQKFKINEKEYEIKLMSIGKKNLKGQNFPFFEFYIKF